MSSRQDRGREAVRSHLKPHLHHTCSLFLGTQKAKNLIYYYFVNNKKLLKRAKRVESRQRHLQEGHFSQQDTGATSSDWAKSKDRHAYLVPKLSWDLFFHTIQRSWKSNQNFPFQGWSAILYPSFMTYCFPFTLAKECARAQAIFSPFFRLLATDFIQAGFTVF